MRAVYHNHHLGLPLLDGCLGDQVPDVGHRGEDNPLVWSDAQIMLPCTRYLVTRINADYKGIISDI